MFTVDYLIVGSGLTGAVIARQLFDAGREVLVVDRRNHMGGNVHDYAHASGIRVHTYGPHYFRTSSDKIWDFVTRFSSFYKYEAALLSNVDNELVQWPIAKSYIDQKIGKDWIPAFKGIPANFEEAALSLMPKQIYEKFVKEYNEKQWGVAASSLSKELCTRFDIRHNDEPKLKPDAKYQGLPKQGYAAWMNNMLQGIPTVLNFDYLKAKKNIKVNKCLFFTGPIDEFFDYELGRLTYRGQKRKHIYMSDDQFQPCGQVNNPTHAGGLHIRTLEWKHMMQPEMAKKISGTLITLETPFTPTLPTDYEYPFPDEKNRLLFSRYKQRAESMPNVVFCGRLGEYKYYDMDQAIARAMFIVEPWRSKQ